MKPIKVLLADDHPIVRRGLRASIEQELGPCELTEAADGHSALQQILVWQPDVVVLDLDMPGMNGLDVAREISSRSLPTSILFLTFHADEQFMRAAMAEGGRGYLLKGSEIDEVCAAIRAVIAGRTYIGSSMTSALLQAKGGVPYSETKNEFAALSVAETRVLRLIADGLSSKEVADELGIHYRTVENHRTNICRKLKLEGANALARYALAHRTSLRQELRPRR